MESAIKENATQRAGFKKGQSGNPSGRPKRTVEELDLIAACKAKTPAALETIVEIMYNGEQEKSRLTAAQYIIDRGYGKPVQQTELTGKNGAPIEVARIELVALAGE